MSGRIHAREFKLEVCRQIANGEKRPSQVCRENTIVDSMLSRWRKEYAERGDAAFAPKLAAELSQEEQAEARIIELERCCGQQAVEIYLLKKLNSQLRSKGATS
jgi:transposase-like protein